MAVLFQPFSLSLAQYRRMHISPPKKSSLTMSFFLPSFLYIGLSVYLKKDIILLYTSFHNIFFDAIFIIVCDFVCLPMPM